MSDHLPVLLVPDADETTRRVLRALRASSETASLLPVADEDAAPEPGWLLRWDRDAEAPLGESTRAVRDADGTVLYYEGILTRTADEPADAPADEGQLGELVAPLLAFSEAVDRAQSPAELHRAALEAAEHLFGTDRVVLLLGAGTEPTRVGAHSGAFGTAATELLAEADRWAAARVSRIAHTIPDFEAADSHLTDPLIQVLVEEEGVGAAQCVPLLHQRLGLGALWAFYDAPRAFSEADRHRGSLLALHLASAFARLDAARPDADAADGGSPDASAADERTAEAEARLRDLVGLSVDASYGLERDADGSFEIAWASKGFQALTGHDAGALRDLDGLLSIVHPSETERVREALLNAPEGEPVRLTHRLLTRAGTVLHVRHAWERAGEGPGPERFTCALLDVTAEQVAAAADAKRVVVGAPLLSQISQDLRAPLTSLLTDADRLAQRAGPGTAEGAARIAEQARRLMNTLNQVVDLTRIEMGDANLDPRSLDLQAEARKVLDLLGPLAEKQGVAVRTRPGAASLDAASLVVYQDPNAVSRVLHALVGEAIARAESGEIAVTLEEAEDAAVVTVTGPGAAAKASTLRGILAERLAALMGGGLTIAQAETETTATLTLPLMDDVLRAAHAVRSPEPEANLEPGGKEELEGGEAPAEAMPSEAAPLPEADASAEAKTPETAPLEAEATDVAEVVLSDATDAELDAEADERPAVESSDVESVAEEVGVGATELEAPPTVATDTDAPEDNAEAAEDDVEAAEDDVEVAEDDVEVADPAPEPISLDAAANAPDAFGAGEGGDPTDGPDASDRGGDGAAGDGAAEGMPYSYSRTEIALPFGVALPEAGLARAFDAPKARTAPALPFEATPAPPAPDADASDSADSKPKPSGLQALDSALDAFSGIDPDAAVEDLEAPSEFDLVGEFATPEVGAPWTPFGEPDAPAPSDEAAGDARLTVLIVEDSEETRILLEQLIGREFDTVAVATPRAALEVLNGQEVDALVLDINLGGRQTGFDILRIARALPGYADIFAMAVTAYGQESQAEQFVEAGFHVYVQKPFETEVLLDPLRALARQRA